MQSVEGSSFFTAVREAGRAPRINPAKIKFERITPANTNIDHTNRIVLAYRIFQAFRKQRDLLAIHLLNGLGQSYSHLQDLLRAAWRQRPLACNRHRHVPQRGKGILTRRGGSQSARRTHLFWRLRSRPSRWRRQRRIALAAAVDALRSHFGPVEG